MARRLADDLSPLARLNEALRDAWATVDAPVVVAILAPALRLVSSRARVVYLLARVQALPYRQDPGGEWINTSAETATVGGDCEDKAALLAVLCVCAGVPARLLWAYQRRRVQDHVSCQVELDGVWLWAEPTLEGAELGESPWVAVERLAVERIDLAGGASRVRSAGRVAGALDGAAAGRMVATVAAVTAVAAAVAALGTAFLMVRAVMPVKGGV